MSTKNLIIKEVNKDYYKGRKNGHCLVCGRTFAYMSDVVYTATSATSGNGKLQMCCSCFNCETVTGNEGYTNSLNKYSRNILEHGWDIEVIAHENEKFYLLDKGWTVKKAFQLNKTYLMFRLENQQNKHKIGGVIKKLLNAGYVVRIYLAGEKKPRRIHTHDEYYYLTKTLVR